MHSTMTEPRTERERALVSALRDALQQRNDARTEVDRLRDKLVESNTSVEYYLRELGELRMEYNEAIRLIDQHDQEASRQRAKADGAVQDAKALERQVENLREVLEGYEIALVTLNMAEAITHFNNGAKSWDMNHQDPLKFLFRMASQVAHPDKGGSAELFGKVQKAFEQLGGGT